MITETIYVAIQGAKPAAWCPVHATRRADGTFHILSRNDDPESEPWEFPPGSVVHCEQRPLGNGIQWVAVAYVRPWPAPRQVWPRQMHPADLKRYLHAHIPLSQAMAVSVVSVSAESVVLGAPLAPNINHRETVFGGSASALAILAAWALLHTRLADAGVASRLVIQRNTMEYERPITGDFTARSSLPAEADWSRFIAMLARRGKARITIDSVLEQDYVIAGRLRGEFVALGTQGR